MRRSPAGNENGHLLVALMVLVAVMIILLTATGQSWTFITQRDAEAEMIFRGEQYARAIEFYRKELGSYPLELKLLAQPGPHRHRFIRKLWKDPVSKDGKWGLLYLSPTGKGYINPYATRRDQEQFLAGTFGEGAAGSGSVPGAGRPSSFGKFSKPGKLGKGADDASEDGEQAGGYTELSKDEFEARGGERAGMPIVGVVHKKKQSGFRIYRNQANLNDWAFTVLAEGEQQEMKVGGGMPVGGFQNKGVGDATSPIAVPSKRTAPGKAGNINPAKEALEAMKAAAQAAAQAAAEAAAEAARARGEQQPEPKEEDDPAEDEDEDPDEDDSEEEEPEEETDPNAADPNAADPNAPVDPNAPADPNGSPQSH